MTKKSKAAEKKLKAAAKQSKKAIQREKKGKSKAADDSDADDVDLEAVLAEYANQQAQFLKVTEVICDPPSPRGSSTLIGSPSNSNELFLFGGEYYNGALATFFNDLFIHLIDRGEWRKVTSPNSPLPRSGHAWCRGENSGGIYVFGGEFSSPKQGTFYHYNDFWRLDPSTREWTRLETKSKGPPARSGHRMTYFKNYIILYGGFQDTSQQTKYLQDLWIYDCQNFVWYNPVLPPATQKPDARSSFSFLPHKSGAVLYGGYARVKAMAAAGRQTKGGNQGVRSVLKPIVYQDTWVLQINQPASEAPPNTPPTVRWERRKKPTNSPNPPRAGATMAYHKGRGIAFGGVFDIEESEEGIDSEFFDTLYAWNIDRNRFFQLTLRQPRGPPKRQVIVDRATKRGRGKTDEEELLRNLAALETKASIADLDAMDIDTVPEAEDEGTKAVQPVLMTMPQKRFNAQLAVQDDVLYIFGGTYENGDREYTFDEMYAIDLGKLDGVKEIFNRELENWIGSDDEEGDSQNEDEDYDDSDNDTEIDMESSTIDQSSLEDVESVATLVEDDSDQTDPVADNKCPHPRPFESLREFYARTSTTWQEILIENSGNSIAISIKGLRKVAFELAETKWWDSREEITALEDQHEEAGIGEVVSIGNRELEGAGPGRRR